LETLFSEPLNITWEEQQLEQVEGFEYRRAIVTADGKTDEEINRRVQNAHQILYQLANTIVGDKDLNEDILDSISTDLTVWN
jgi:hypothetical protein